jgi:hypothetical protein
MQSQWMLRYKTDRGSCGGVKGACVERKREQVGRS